MVRAVHIGIDFGAQQLNARRFWQDAFRGAVGDSKEIESKEMRDKGHEQDKGQPPVEALLPVPAEEQSVVLVFQRPGAGDSGRR